MKILAKCQSCKKKKLFLRKRTFQTKYAGIVTSQSLLCGGCARGMRAKMREM